MVSLDLIVAAQNGDCFEVTRLLDAGGNIDETNEHGQTSMYYALWKNKLDVAKVLFDRGADLKIKTMNGTSMLYGAAIGADKATTEWLLHQDEVLNMINDQNYNNSTPLIFSVSFNNLITTPIILEYGADASIVDEYGKNAFEWAKSDGMKALLRSHGLGTKKEMENNGVVYSTKYFASVNDDLKSSMALAVTVLKIAKDEAARVLKIAQDEAARVSKATLDEATRESKAAKASARAEISRIVKLKSTSSTITQLTKKLDDSEKARGEDRSKAENNYKSLELKFDEECKSMEARMKDHMAKVHKALNQKCGLFEDEINVLREEMGDRTKLNHVKVEASSNSNNSKRRISDEGGRSSSSSSSHGGKKIKIEKAELDQAAAKSEMYRKALEASGVDTVKLWNDREK